MKMLPVCCGMVATLVSYEGIMNGRFRHNAHFRHWRDDKVPDECTYSQLDELAPTELLEMFGV